MPLRVLVQAKHCVYLQVETHESYLHEVRVSEDPAVRLIREQDAEERNQQRAIEDAFRAGIRVGYGMIDEQPVGRARMLDSGAALTATRIRRI